MAKTLASETPPSLYRCGRAPLRHFIKLLKRKHDELAVLSNDLRWDGDLIGMLGGR
jgi:hypothetical protein